MNRPAVVDPPQVLDRYRQQLANAAPVEGGVEPPDVLSYFGTWQDSIPRALILDPLLRPAAKVTWQVLRTRLGDPLTPVISPMQEDLARNANISRRTLSTSLLELRLQGWVTTGGQVRSAHAQDRGRFRAQTYLLHDRPLSLEDMIRVDASYLELVSACAHHSSRHLRHLAYGVLDHLRDQAQTGTGLYAESLMPTMHELYQHAETDRAKLRGRLRRRLGCPAEEVGPASDTATTSTAVTRVADELEALQPDATPEAGVEEEQQPENFAHGEYVSKEIKIAEKQQVNTTNDPLNILRTAELGENPRSGPCANFAHGLLSSSSCINNTTTVQAHDTHASERAHTEAGFGYWLPKDLLALDGMPEQLPQIATALEAILEGDLAELRQAVLDEWAGCIRAAVQGYREPIGQPLAYLRGMALKARRPNTSGREGFHTTGSGKAIAQERRLASQSVRTVPGGTLVPLPLSHPAAALTDRSPQQPSRSTSAAAATADPGFLRHARNMLTEWQHRFDRAEQENAPDRVRISARNNRDYWLNQVDSLQKPPAVK